MSDELLATLLSKVYGQDTAVKAVWRAIKRQAAGFHRNDKPVGAFLFAGPSGCGKTHTAKMIAECLGCKLIRIDCSEYSEGHEVAKLLGSPAGYIGHDNVPLLTRSVIGANGKFVLLIDECEKAGGKLLDIFLQILDYGVLTDSRGTELSFTQALVIFTTNLGSKGYSGKKCLGFIQHSDLGSIEKETDRMLREHLRIELINRLTGTLIFRPLDKASYESIIGVYLGDINDILAPKRISISLSDGVIEQLIGSGVSNEFGARGLKRVFISMVEDYLIDAIQAETIKEGSHILLYYEDSLLMHRRIGSCSLIRAIAGRTATNK